MANNYTQFSVDIYFGGDEATKQRRWFDGVQWVLSSVDPDYDDGPDFIVGNEQNLGPLTHGDALAIVKHRAEFSSSVSLEIDSDCVLIHSDECGDPDLAALIIEMYLRHFHANYGVLLEFAMTCSKMRPGEFGGGAAYVTRFGVDWWDKSSWLKEQQERIAAKIAREARRKRKVAKPAKKRIK